MYQDENRKLVLRNMFDENIYYKKLSNFQKPLSSYPAPFIDAKFSENGNEIIVTYMSGEEGEKTTETIKL